MFRSWKRWAWLVGLALFLGCGPEAVWVTRRPAFNYEKIHRIGVLRFATVAKGPDAEGMGAVISDKIARLLVEHRDYETITPDQIAKALDEKKYAPPSPLDAEAVKKIGAITGVDTLVTGAATRCAFKKTEQTRFQPQYTDTGYALYQDASVPYNSTRLEAEVAADLRVYDTATGALVWSDSFGHTSWAQGAPPPRTRQQLVDDASDQVSAKLFLRLVVNKDFVKVPPDSVFTCADFVGNQYVHRTAEFSARDEKVFVALALGSGFNDTPVTVKIFKKGDKAPVAKADIVWNGKIAQAGLPFSVKELTSKSGFGKYEAKYFIDDREIRSTDFNIRAAK